MPIVLSRKGGVAGTATGGQALSIGVSTGGNTAGDTTVNSGSRFVIVGSNGITASQGTALGATTVTLLGEGVRTPLSLGVSTGGNTAGNTTVNSGSRFVLVASGNATASQATAAGASTITISVGTQTVQTQGVVSLGVSTGGNTSGDTTVNTGSRFVLAGGDNITLSQATAAGATTVTISAGAAAAVGTLSMWPDQVPNSTTAGMSQAGTFTSAATRTTLLLAVFPMAVPAFLTVNKIKVPLVVSMTSATTTAHWNWTAGHSFGIYTLTGDSLSLVSSFSNHQRLTYSSAANSTNASLSWQLSYGSGAALSSSSSFSSNNAGVTGPWSSISSNKNHPLAKGAMSLSAGQYFGVFGYSSSSAGANLGNLLQIGINSAAGNAQSELGENILSVNAYVPLQGRVTVTQTDTALPVSFATADISTRTNDANAIRLMPYIQMLSQE